MVKEVGDDNKESRLAVLIAVVDDSGGQMGLAATIVAHEHQPAIG